MGTPRTPWIAIVLAACAGDGRRPLAELSGTTMGTTYSVKLLRPERDEDRDLLHARVHEVLSAVDARMSTYRADSELSRFNASRSTDWFAVSGDTRDVVAEGLRVGRLTGGALDITVGRLVRLWGFGPERREGAPPAPEIAAARRSVGYQKVHVRANPPAIRKDDPSIELDLSALAKGFAVDAVVKTLRGHGVQDCLVEVGGELRGSGRNRDGQPWQIAIESPDTRDPAPRRVVALADRAIATSGDYRNWRERDGTRFSHVLDPRTGHPITHAAASVTVLAESTMTADALSTALLVLGPDDAMRLAGEHGLSISIAVRAESGLVELVNGLR